jgi:hypothetical protein
VYRFTPDETDRKRAHHQAVKQGCADVRGKRIGNLGELAFEAFCREYLPVDLWEWLNEDAVRRCRPESFAGHDFEVFGFEVDVKTSRDVAAFRPETLLDRDPDDDIVVMAWHRDDENSIILLGWERLSTLASKVAAQDVYSGNAPEKLEHLPARPMTELLDLGPDTAYLDQTPTNPFVPGDRVVKAGDEAGSVGVVVDALPPEQDVGVYGNTFDGEAVEVAYPSTLDGGPGDWRDVHPALLASYCDDQQITCYTFKHTNLAFAPNPYVAGDRVVHTGHDDPDLAFVVDTTDDGVAVRYEGQFDGTPSAETLADLRERDAKCYHYDVETVAFPDRT